jgi:hypothetical protein
MYGDGPIADGPIADFAIKPAKIPDKLAEQLRQLRRELPPQLLNKWGAVIEEAAGRIGGRPPEGHLAMEYIDEQMALGRQLDLGLIKEASEQTLVHRKTVKRWLTKRGMQWTR